MWLWELVSSPSLRGGFPHGPRGVPALSPQDQLASVVSMLKLPASCIQKSFETKIYMRLPVITEQKGPGAAILSILTKQRRARRGSRTRPRSCVPRPLSTHVFWSDTPSQRR